MRARDAIDRTIAIVTAYYENDLEPFLDALSDDVLWIGPAERQVIRGKADLVAAFAAERHNLTFSMGAIKAQCVSATAHVKEVVLRYPIATHFPSGAMDVHNQRLHFTWRERRVRTPAGSAWHAEVLLVHIGNAWRYDPQDTIYPVHYENVIGEARRIAGASPHVTLRATDGAVHRIPVSDIVFIETVKRSAHLVVHTADDEIVVVGTLPALEERYPSQLLRIHASYLVNPAHVHDIRRFAVTLSDGTALPVPQKRYTQVKRSLLREER